MKSQIKNDTEGFDQSKQLSEERAHLGTLVEELINWGINWGIEIKSSVLNV